MCTSQDRIKAVVVEQWYVMLLCSHVNNATTSSDMMYSIADVATRLLGVNVDVGGDAL